MGFMRGMGYELGKAIARWEQVSNMSQQEYEKHKKAEEARKKKEEQRKREAYKRAFGVYPEQTWRW